MRLSFLRISIPVVLIAFMASAIIALRAPAADPPAKAPPTSDPPAKPAPAANWQSLFDGKTLGKWQVSDFAGHGTPEVEDGNIVLPFGEALTGITYSGEVPKMNYEIELQAKKVNGSDFFCGLTFPVNDSFASLICGGWGGTIVGISSLDEKDANRNETRLSRKFDKDKWYTIRMRILPDRLMAWIDNEKVVDVATTGRKISTRVEVEASKPFGISSYQTTAALRQIRIRTLNPDEIPATQPAK
ncbi:MAG TPA: DUF1080 domain-containing protein [Tepidisphaeraceae bacterium]|jgi:hypothetical protein|nr:DUF1080 domain-containing protein [Tepidisphaeraceae bacterium]